jgi:hypothetical protein
MARQICTISQAAVLRQAVLNTSNSLELFREAVSNSIDAGCKAIDLRLTNCGGDLWDVVIQDDGHGMTENHMAAFFNTGESVKDTVATGAGASLKNSLSIGEKGLGSKTTFVANTIRIESLRSSELVPRIGTMEQPMEALKRNEMPSYEIRQLSGGEEIRLSSLHGTRIELNGLRVPTFNGKACADPQSVADRLLHYLRTQCAAGTVKNRFAAYQHINELILNPGLIPQITLEVVWNGFAPERRGPMPGAYQVPTVDVDPANGPKDEHTGVERNSDNFCDLLDFSHSKTLAVQGQLTTVYYEGTVIIAGKGVRAKMLEHELKQGWTQKSQMGLHLCKDFVPMKVDGPLSRELLGNEHYFEFKAFLNCQWFTLNADRNTVTNLESDEVAWIWPHFKEKVWPQVDRKYQIFREMRDAEEKTIDAIRKANDAIRLKNEYTKKEALTIAMPGVSIAFAKSPRNEADVSHLLAMLVQSGEYKSHLVPIARFGSYIDRSTDLLCETDSGAALLVEVEKSLPNLFVHGHPIASYDVVVVWDLGGMKNEDFKQADWGDKGAAVNVTLLGNRENGWRLKWGINQKKLIVLSDFV